MSTVEEQRQIVLQKARDCWLVGMSEDEAIKLINPLDLTWVCDIMCLWAELRSDFTISSITIDAIIAADECHKKHRT